MVGRGLAAFAANPAERAATEMVGSSALHRRATALFCSLALVCISARSASAAEPQPPQEQAGRPSAGRRALSAGAAVVPGALVHGSGHWALGEPTTARRLLLLEGIGIGLVLGGGSVIVLTGASRYLVGPAAAVTVTGFGLFSTSLIADLYGTLSSDGGAARPLHTAPWIETELGYRRLDDSQFSHSDFLVQRLTSRVGRFRVEPSLWASLAADTARYRTEVGYRAFGPVPDRRSSTPNWFEVETGFTHQRHGPDGFAMSSAELSLVGRYDLAELGRTLRGAFLEGGLGAAVQRIDYDLERVTVPSDGESLVLARFGFGVVLRGASGPGSELLAYYDHRHDGYVAGLKIAGLGSGVAGHFGLAGRWFFGDELGVALDAQLGSAHVLGGSILFRQGARR